MNPYLALFIYISTLIYFYCNLRGSKPISRWDYFVAGLSYAFLGLAWVIEQFTKQ